MVADNLKLETKIGDQMENSILHSMRERALSSNLTLSATENHMETPDHEKKTVENTVDNVKANNTAPRTQEPNGEKIDIAGIDRKVTINPTKNKMPATKECTNIKARPSIKLTMGRPSIRQTKTQARINKRAETRVDKHAETRVNERAETRVDERAETRVDERAKVRSDARADSGNRNPDGTH